MWRLSVHRISLILSLLVLSNAVGQLADKVAFFESRIRPVLVEQCYSCHNSNDAQEAGLALDFRDGIREETEHGIVVVPGAPDKSLIIKVMRHQIVGIEMPEDGGKLSPAVVGDFESWIRDGAIDPRDHPPTVEELANATSWEATLAKRKKWWSLQPIKPVAVPESSGSKHPVDAFIMAGLESNGLMQSPSANNSAFLRRLTLVITGFPPTLQQIEAFEQLRTPEEYSDFVDELLASKSFGERWARHFMDVLRYAESHGSEGDPAIPFAYQYRDYLIRALNGDVPYDQLVREHIAGDLLEAPRTSSSLGINESAIGTAHWRMVFHGFAPTDALDEKVRFVDDQINVYSKAFLGLTLSCARCHNHKFDAISQADYYAMFGVLAGCRPAIVDVNTRERQMMHQDRLLDLKSQLRKQVANVWSNAEYQDIDVTKFLPDLKAKVAEFESFADAWNQVVAERHDAEAAAEEDRSIENRWYSNLADSEDYRANWFAAGNGLPKGPHSPGDFGVAVSGDDAVSRIFPGGVRTNSLSNRHRGVLSSKYLRLDGEYRVWFHLAGKNGATARYCVQNYPRDGTVFPIHNMSSDEWQLPSQDLAYWDGDEVHFEFATAKDGPVIQRNGDDSWFAVREVIVRGKGAPPPKRNQLEFLQPLIELCKENPPSNVDELNDRLRKAIRTTAIAWSNNQTSDAQALFLNQCLNAGLLVNATEQLGVSELIEDYRRLESEIPQPVRVVGLAESEVADHPLFERGNHLRPQSTVPRRFLEAIDPEPFGAVGSGRLELAERLLDEDNPLTSRVIVNRIWHYVFGNGIVATPDNFGKLGALPTHPELLDYLADGFRNDGWSIKRLIKSLVLTDTFRASPIASDRSREKDPENRWLSHANIRRLDAEAIRDSLLLVSGELNDEMYGKSAGANGSSKRRSVYVASRRNSLDQFLTAFDSPVPFAATGLRSNTNVPAQSLMMLNAPAIRDLATSWAVRCDEQLGKSPAAEEKIRHMYVSAFGSHPTRKQMESLASIVDELESSISARNSKLKETSESLASVQQTIDKILLPSRASLREAGEAVKAGKTAGGTEGTQRPFARWDFTESLDDQVGNLNATTVGAAKRTDEGLVTGGGHAFSPAGQSNLSEKTLVATVRLDNLDQTGSGLISVQTKDTHRFDAIVFGEREPRHWISGSDSFTRTDDLGGVAETMLEPVHMAIAYHTDGTIRAFRNGKPYGQPSKIASLAKYKAGDWQVLFGMRHGNRGNLSGTILDAALYDAALPAEEIASLAKGTVFISDKQVVEAMNEQQRAEYNVLNQRLESLRNEQEELGPSNQVADVWARFAHILFNSKQFIYLN